MTPNTKLDIGPHHRYSAPGRGIELTALSLYTLAYLTPPHQISVDHMFSETGKVGSAVELLKRLCDTGHSYESARFFGQITKHVDGGHSAPMAIV